MYDSVILAQNNQNTLIVQLVLPHILSRIRRYIPLSFSRMFSSLIDQDQVPLLLHMIKFRIWVRLEYFINQLRPDWPSQNVTWVNLLTWMSQPSFNSDMHSLLASYTVAEQNILQHVHTCITAWLHFSNSLKCNFWNSL